MKGYTATERTSMLGEMLGEMRTNLAAIEASYSLASPGVELDLRLASDCLDHAACLLRVIQHDRHMHLWEGT